jgi:hypothetical protein
MKKFFNLFKLKRKLYVVTSTRWHDDFIEGIYFSAGDALRWLRKNELGGCTSAYEVIINKDGSVDLTDLDFVER